MLADLDLLLFIADHEINQPAVHLSTVSIAKHLCVSQQSISRRLGELETQGLICKKSSFTGTAVTLTSKGQSVLKQHYLRLLNLFEKKTNFLEGKVTGGLGEGAYYIKIYSPLLQQTLGFKPFAGTLNLSVDPMKAEAFLSRLKPQRIEGFQKKDRTFGGITVFPVSIQSTPCAILAPDRTRHDPSILEIISAQSLRNTLKSHKQDVIRVDA